MIKIGTNEQPCALSADEIARVAGGWNTAGNTPLCWQIQVAGMTVSYCGGVEVTFQHGGHNWTVT
jgi:hypothetical protein